MSQSQSQSQLFPTSQFIWEAITLIKFSHLTVQVDKRPVATPNWTHIKERDDLQLLFRTARGVGHLGNLTERILLNVVAGADELVLHLDSKRMTGVVS
jgi:hypothetical protein